MPIYHNGHPNFRFHPYPVSVTAQSAHRIKHFDRLDPFRQRLTEYWLQQCGTSLAEVRDSKTARMRVCIKFYQGLAACSGTKIYFVSGFDCHHRDLLLHSGARSHLLSYAELKGKRADVLRDYIGGGP